MVSYRPLIHHVLFWGLFVSIYVGYETLGRTQGSFTPGQYLAGFGRLATWVDAGRVMLTVYLSLWVFTRYAFPRQLLLILSQIMLLGLLDAILKYLLQQYVLGPLVHDWPAPLGGTALLAIRGNLLASWVFVLLAFVLKHLRDHYRSETLLHEKNAMELAYLRAQLNPHFLFNSMNNLYGLALTEPESTPDAILKLSELMRYMLYESNADRVSLAQEVEYLSSYIALEKLRHEGAVYIDFAVEGNLVGCQIAPLLLICFVENAFKHGTVHNPAHPLQLHLTVREGHIYFTTRNQIVAQNKDLTGGVGLPTVRRRLALLYPQQHHLAITDHDGTFHCVLDLDVCALVAVPNRPAFA
ncbi:MAG: sensor histidine kinase [Hymenobacter sp.]|nr:sensor histidine kinase [Hymenobacter sp.]